MDTKTTLEIVVTFGCLSALPFAVNDGAGCYWLASSAVREARPTMGSLCSIGPPQDPLQSCIALRSYTRNSFALPPSANNSAPGRKNRNLWR